MNEDDEEFLRLVTSGFPYTNFSNNGCCENPGNYSLISFVSIGSIYLCSIIGSSKIMGLVSNTSAPVPFVLIL